MPTDLENIKIDDEMKARLEEFLTRLQTLINTHYEKFDHVEAPMLEIDPGRRYLRIAIRRDDGSRYVHCFIDTTNSDILKSEGWKKPAKHARANLNDDDYGMSGVTVYGAVYIR